MYLDRPKVMGILNVTPDSFYSGSRVQAVDQALESAQAMHDEGVTIFDVGGVSTRPGADEVSIEEELQRVIPVLNALKVDFPDLFVSVDTYQSKVAVEAVKAGADIVNDVSAGSIDEHMYDAVADLNVPYILMHMKGTPKTMQHRPSYENVSLEVLDFFIAELNELRKRNIKDVILDPGFGFGKTIAHNYQLLNSIHAFRFLECPILAGLSRKSMIYKPLGIEPKDALNGSTALHMKALLEGAQLIRTHDVKEAVETIKLFELLQNHQAQSG